MDPLPQQKSGDHKQIKVHLRGGRHDSLSSTEGKNNQQQQNRKEENKKTAEFWNRSSDLDKKQKRQKGGSRQLPAFH
jgi:hypothetical protein